MATKEFKLTRAVKIYEVVIVEAETREEALKLYDEDEIEGWEEDDVGAADGLGLISIDERGPGGEFSVCHDVEDGEFVLDVCIAGNSAANGHCDDSDCVCNS